MTPPIPAPTPARRLVLWNIDLTLVDVVQVTRAACVEAFERVTGGPLVRLPAMAGRTDSEIFFEALALNPIPSRTAVPVRGGGLADAAERQAQLADALAEEALLPRYTDALAAAFAARRDELLTRGRLLPGAREALSAVGRLPGVVQTVLTGSIRPNALAKLAAFRLAEFLDTGVGGYGSEVYPKGAMLLNTRGVAGREHGTRFGEDVTVYLGDAAGDVAAAKVGGARSIAVATGRSSNRELREAHPDAMLPDLTDTAAVVAAIDQLTSRAR